MNNDTYINVLEQKHKECIDTCNNECSKTDEVLDTYKTQFQPNIMNNIQTEFCDYIDVIVGKRLNTRLQSEFNTTCYNSVFANDNVAKLPPKEHIKTIHNNKVLALKNKPIYITTGRNFGVSLYNNNNNKRTRYIHKSMYFSHLTQEHVNCIKEKLVRDCVQEFIDFRNEFITKNEMLYNKLINVNIPAKTAYISNFTKEPTFSGGGNSNSVKSKLLYRILDNISDDVITHIHCTIPKISIWDKVSPLRLYDIKCSAYRSEREAESTASMISVNFITKTSGCHNYDFNRNITYLNIVGNFDMTIDKIVHSLQTPETRGAICNRIRHATIEIPDYCILPAIKILFDMDKVLQHPSVKHEIDMRIKFYIDASTKLQELKYKHASLYFCNSD